MKVAVAQMEVAPFERRRNLVAARRLVREAAEAGASLVLLPELFQVGYVLDDRLFAHARPLAGDDVRWLRLVAEREGVEVLGTVLEADGRKVYDALVWASPDGGLRSYRKTYPVLFENPFFWRGRGPAVLAGAGLRVGAMIGGEMARRRFLRAFAGRVDLVVIPAAWPSRRGSDGNLPLVGPRWDRMPTARPAEVARALGVPVLFANQCGAFETRLPPAGTPFRAGFLGHSGIYGPDGEVRARLGRCETGIVLGELELSEQAARTARA